MSKEQVKIALIGGTGFYDFFEGESEEREIKTDFGPPSDKIMVGELFGRKVAFLARHGRKHHLPPHKIPYRANIAALKELGVERIIAPAAVGSLRKEIKPGDFVLCDQFIDQTKRREDTFFNGPQVAHIEMAYPYCSELRGIAASEANKLSFPVRAKGTVVVMEGPRFSTLADSLRFSQMGADLINMTQYPEVVLASEMGICYLNVSLVTDYDAGIYAQGKVKPVSIAEVLKNFEKNTQKLKEFVSALIKTVPEKRRCSCQKKAQQALLS
jgi:5'-methylthioadenosine phosphorylase